MFYNAIIYHRWVISTRGQRYNTHDAATLRRVTKMEIHRTLLAQTYEKVGWK